MEKECKTKLKTLKVENKCVKTENLRLMQYIAENSHDCHCNKQLENVLKEAKSLVRENMRLRELSQSKDAQRKKKPISLKGAAKTSLTPLLILKFIISLFFSGLLVLKLTM